MYPSNRNYARSYAIYLSSHIRNRTLMQRSGTYLNTRKENPGKPLIIMNNELVSLEKLANSSPHSPFIKSTIVTVKKLLLSKHLMGAYN